MNVCRVQFKNAGKRYFFHPGELNISPNDQVVVETVRGLELGKVVGSQIECPSEIETEIKPIIRIATSKDLENFERNQELEKDALMRCKELVSKNELDMKLVGCEYTLDRSKVIFYFESDNRVDFRQLVKDLAEELKVRIELRQIGSRDGAKMIGGLGPCGLVICCRTFIGEFDNVSIKMAKNQNLSLNPQKISGTCGKLLCCIKYENDVYTELRKSVPDVNDIVSTITGEAKVLSVDVLNRNLKVKYLNDDSFGFLRVEDVKNIKPSKRNDDREDLKDLE